MKIDVSLYEGNSEVDPSMSLKTYPHKEQGASVNHPSEECRHLDWNDI